MSIPFTIFNKYTLTNNLPQNSTFMYTFNNNPAGSVVYPKLVSGVTLTNRIPFQVFAYASFNDQIVTTDPTQYFKFYFLDNLNGIVDINLTPIMDQIINVGINKVSNQSLAGLNSPYYSNTGFNSVDYPYLAVQISPPNPPIVPNPIVISGTLIIQILSYPLNI